MATIMKLKGLLSYPRLFQTHKASAEAEPKYSVGLLIAKNDPQIAQILAVIESEKALGFPSGFPHNASVCLKDCAIEFADQPNIAAYMFISSSTGADSKPPVVDASRQPIMDPSLAYAGAEAWVALNIKSFDKPINKGVTAYLQAVMLTGEESAMGRIDGRPTVDQLFGDMPMGAPSAAPQPLSPAPGPDYGVQAAPAAMPPPPLASVAGPPVYQMTAAANGATREQFIAQGWTDALLIEKGMMLPPGGVQPSFMG